MSQSPTDATSLQSSEKYLDNWNAMGEMISQGISFSGRERNRLFLNTRSTRFADVSAAAGLDLIDDGRGIACVDWDHDGDLDLWLSSRTGPRVRLMRNDANTRNHFLAIRLQGTTCNRDAIGARVEVHFDAKTSRNRKIINTLRAGQGFLSQSGKWLHFGLGEDAVIDRVVVHWPGSGTQETLADISVNGRYRIVQGSGHAIEEKQRGEVRIASSKASPAQSTERSRTVLTQRLPVKDLFYENLEGRTCKLVAATSSPQLINLWATWCQPCVAELRQLVRQAEHLGDLKVFALCTDGLRTQGNEDQGDGVAAARQLAARLQLPFETGVASEIVIEELTRLDHSVFYRQRALPIPCSFLLDRRGKLAAIYKGPVDIGQLISDLDLLNAKRRQLELAASPFPGRRIVNDYDPSPLGSAAAYLDGGYLDDAREQALKHLSTVSSVTDLDELATTLLESLRPGALHERTGAMRVAFSGDPNPRQQHDPRNEVDGTRLRRSLQIQQQLALVRGYQLLARIEQHRKAFNEQIDALGHLVRLQPEDVTAKANLAVALARQERMEEANTLLRRAKMGKENDSQTLVVLGQARLKMRQVDAAVELFDSAIVLEPKNVEARLNLAIVRQMQGNTNAAVEQYHLILKDDPKCHEALNNLAWILATDKNPSSRNGAEAVSLATRLCESTSHQEPAYLDTLAAALAETGEFRKAIRTTAAAMALARGKAEHDLANTLANRIQIYTDGKTIRD